MMHDIQVYSRSTRGELPALPRQALPEGPVAYLDIETTGLEADESQVTVVGLVAAARGERRLRQYFVERPGDEADVLRAVLGVLRKFAGTVTYNGAGFDLPFLRQRAWAHDIRWPWVETFDLLKVAFAWRDRHGELPNCRLQTVMEHFGVGRTDATSGEEMIDAYARWRRTGRTEDRDVILEHNAQDLLLLPDVVPHLLAGPGGPGRAVV